jgi:hypothetical protein
MALPSIEHIVYAWRKTLSARIDPPIREYVQSNQLFSCELVSTSQIQDAPIETLLTGSNTGVVVTAAAITTSQSCLWVMLQAHPDNTANILIGNSSGQTWIMIPGAVTVIPIDNVAKIIAKSAAGTQVLNGMWGY